MGLFSDIKDMGLAGVIECAGIERAVKHDQAKAKRALDKAERAEREYEAWKASASEDELQEERQGFNNFLERMRDMKTSDKDTNSTLF